MKRALDAAGVAWADDEATLARFGHDEADVGDYPPELVAFPETTAQVQAVLRACLAAQRPCIPVGARTGKSGGSLAPKGGVALSLERMNRIVSVDAEDLTLTAEPGVILKDVYAAAEAVGLFYAPDPNSWESCSLGGTVAENAGGPSALKYGVTRDSVLALEWVLPTGEVIEVGHRTHKGVAGYDLVGLFVGSEGTLGIATKITVKLRPRPRVVMTALLPFADVVAAARAVSQVLTAGLLPRALELLDDVALAAVDGHGFNFPSGAGACVIAEVDGATEAGVLGELELVCAVAQAHGALEPLVAQGADQRARLWAARRLVSPRLRALEGLKLSDDIVVPRSKVPEAIAAFKAIGQRFGLTVATYGHAGDGNLHTNLLFTSPAQRPQVEAALSEILRHTVALGGTITGEHGVGLAKARYLPFEQSAFLIELQRRLKVFFDPSVILNPGKVFPEG